MCDIRSLDFGVAVGGSISSLSGLGWLVRLDIEVDEEPEVAREEHAAEDCSSLGTGAGTECRPVPVVGSEVGVGAKVNSDEVDDELGDLHGGEIFLPPDFGTARRGEVVVVHEDVYCEVEGDRHPRNASLAIQLSVTKQSGGGVVENVQESKGLLLQPKEHGIDELDVFEEIVDHIIEFQSRSPGSEATQCVEKTMIPKNRRDFLNHENEQNAAADGEYYIVHLEEKLETQSGSVLHKVLDGEYDGEV